MDVIKELKKIKKERAKVEEQYYKDKEKLAERERDIIGVSEGQVLDTVAFAEAVSKLISK